MFFSNCEKVKQIKKGFELTKNMHISVLLYGEEHIGKKSLVHTIYPNAFWMNGADISKAIGAIADNGEIVIYNFNTAINYEISDFNNKKIIAIANTPTIPEHIDTLFGFVYKLPPLSQRREDLDFFIEKYQKEANQIFGKQESIVVDKNKIDLSQNIKSLKNQIYKSIALQNLSKDEIETILYSYFVKKMEGNNDYVKFLKIFETPLIEAGLKKYGSQLKLATILGINRNTLRKKVSENGIG